MFEKHIYIERRHKLKLAVGTGLIVLLGNEESSMNYADNQYPFRQDSTFLYFFGIDRPGLIALIDIDSDKEIIFGDDLTIEQMGVLHNIHSYYFLPLPWESRRGFLRWTRWNYPIRVHGKIK